MENKRNTRSHYKIINGEVKGRAQAIWYTNLDIEKRHEELIMYRKKSYDTEKQALMVTRFLNSRPESIHQMIAYKCSKCDKWHIGSTGKLLTAEDKSKYEQKLRNNIG